MSQPFDPRMGVRAHAIVDQLDRLPVAEYKVTVWGEPPHALERVYKLRTISEDAAAKAGIRMFVAEMKSLQASNDT